MLVSTRVCIVLELLIDIRVTLVSHAYINLSLQWDLAPIPIDSKE